MDEKLSTPTGSWQSDDDTVETEMTPSPTHNLSQAVDFPGESNTADSDEVMASLPTKNHALPPLAPRAPYPAGFLETIPEAPSSRCSDDFDHSSVVSSSSGYGSSVPRDLRNNHLKRWWKVMAHGHLRRENSVGESSAAGIVDGGSEHIHSISETGSLDGVSLPSADDIHKRVTWNDAVSVRSAPLAQVAEESTPDGDLPFGFMKGQRNSTLSSHKSHLNKKPHRGRLMLIGFVFFLFAVICLGLFFLVQHVHQDAADGAINESRDNVKGVDDNFGKKDDSVDLGNVTDGDNTPGPSNNTKTDILDESVSSSNVPSTKPTHIPTLAPMKPATSIFHVPSSNPTSVPVITLPPAGPPTTFPTLAPSQMPSIFDQANAATKSLIRSSLSDDGVDALNNPSSAHSKALNWLLNGDGASFELDIGQEQSGAEVVSETRILQRYAMALFYYSLGGLEGGGWDGSGASISKLDFLSSAHECDYAGVECAAITFESLGTWDAVLAIHIDDLANLGVNERRIPEDIWLLPFLQKLSLVRGGIQGPIPSSLMDLPDLFYLDLSENAMTGSVPNFGPTMEFLYLSQNNFVGVMPHLWQISNEEESGDDSILPPPQLRYLWVDRNNFYGQIPSEIGQLTELRSLHLHDNFFSSAVPESISSLVNLEYIDISYNNLSGEIPDGLFNLTNLYRLYMTSNNLFGTLSHEISRLFKLENLWLHSNALTGTVPPQLEDLVTLTQLYLHDNRLHGSVPENVCHLFDMASLEELEVDCFNKTSEYFVDCPCCTACH